MTREECKKRLEKIYDDTFNFEQFWLSAQEWLNGRSPDQAAMQGDMDLVVQFVEAAEKNRRN
ncbi:MAG: hypothetical protein AAF822_16615 [Pseudomonadota bacterium]